MKRLLSVFIVLFCFFAQGSLHAQSLLDQFNFIGDQAEALEPGLFPGSQVTMTAQEMGYDWYFRYYPSTQTYIALNIDLLDIYTFGGPWPEPTRIDSLGNILALLGYVPPGDGGGDGGGGGGSGNGGGEGNRILNAGSASCLDLLFPSVGTVTVHSGTVEVPEIGEAQLSYTTTYTEVTADSITTTVDQTITANGETISTSSSTTTSFYEVIDDWLFSTRVESEITTMVASITTTATSNITFDPSRFETPLSICSGLSWFIASVTSNTTGTAGGFPIPDFSGPTGDQIIEVVSLNESLTVPAGTFSTVHELYTNLDLVGDPEERTDSWFINALGGIPAKIQSYDEFDNVTSVIELQSVTTN
jgi:hypothetical protein